MKLHNILISPLLLVIASVQTARACTCVEISQEENLKYAAAVFDGKVTAITYLLEIPGSAVFPTIYRKALVAFEVIEFWKGNLEKSVEVIAWNHELMCGGGYTFEIGQRYVVYARNGLGADKDKFSGTGCGQRIEKDVANERKVLGRGRKPK